MVIDRKVFDTIVYEVTEAVLLRMPEVIGNLIQNHAEINKLTKSFYEKYPEFKKDPVTVKSIVGMLDRENAGMKYEDILKQAAPMIKERMKTISGLNISDKPERSSLDLNIDMSTNGEL